MKYRLLALTLLAGACQSPNGAPQPVQSSVPAATVAPADAGTQDRLPRWNHLEHTGKAVRAWVRDRS